MQLSNLRYSNINAKLKGMNAKGLNKKDIYDLAKQNDFSSAVYFLKNELEVLKNINENSDRIMIEKELDKITINDIYKIERVLNQKEKEIFDKFISKYEINCIKEVLKNLNNNVDMKKKLENIDIWTKNVFKHIDGITNVDTEDEFLAKIKKSLYYKLIKKYFEEKDGFENISINEIEILLDQKYFLDLFKVAKEYDSNLENLIGERIDLLNIIWIYRMKKNYNISNEETESKLIKVNYKLSKKMNYELIKANDFEEMRKILKDSCYWKIVENTKENELEKNIDKYLYKKYELEFSKSKYNISMVFCYMFLQEIKMQNIIIILEGLNYYMPRSEIERKIIN